MSGKEIATAVTPFLSIDEMIRRIHRGWTRYLVRAEEARVTRLDVGFTLLALRQRIEAGELGKVEWWPWYEEKFTRSRRDAERLMEIASADNPQAALKDRRAYDAAQSKAHRVRQQAQIALATDDSLSGLDFIDEIAATTDRQSQEPGPPSKPKRHFTSAESDDALLDTLENAFRQLSWNGCVRWTKRQHQLFNERKRGRA